MGSTTIRVKHSKDIEFLGNEYTELEHLFVKLEEDNLDYADAVGFFYTYLKINESFVIELVSDEKIVGFALIVIGEELEARSLYIEKEHRNLKNLMMLLKKAEEFSIYMDKTCNIVCSNEKLEKLYDKRYKKEYTLYSFNGKD